MKKVIVFIIGTILIWIVGYFISNFLYGFIYGIADNFNWINDNTTLGTFMKMQYCTTVAGYVIPLFIANWLLGNWAGEGEWHGRAIVLLVFCVIIGWQYLNGTSPAPTILINVGFFLFWLSAIIDWNG
jgi:hypothetical protein